MGTWNAEPHEGKRTRNVPQKILPQGWEPITHSTYKWSQCHSGKKALNFTFASFLSPDTKPVPFSVSKKKKKKKWLHVLVLLQNSNSHLVLGLTAINHYPFINEPEVQHIYVRQPCFFYFKVWSPTFNYNQLTKFPKNSHYSW